MTHAAASHGRICLLGDHCDWAGGASLVMPLAQLQTHVRFVPDGGQVLDVSSPCGDRPVQSRYALPIAADGWTDSADPLRYVAAVAASLEERGFSLSGGQLSIESNLPIGKGFSSSAALCVSVARALVGPTGQNLDNEAAARVAYEAERVRVGVACGLMDQLACAFDRPLLLEWDSDPIGIQPLQLGAQFHFVAGAFHVHGSAPHILSDFSRHHADPQPTDVAEAARACIAEWGELAHSGAKALMSGEVEVVGRAMWRTQELYSTEIAPRIPSMAAPALESVCTSLRDAGAVGAKFTGAGGDRSVIALGESREHAEALRDRMVAQGLSAWNVTIGG